MFALQTKLNLLRVLLSMPGTLSVSDSLTCSSPGTSAACEGLTISFSARLFPKETWTSLSRWVRPGEPAKTAETLLANGSSSDESTMVSPRCTSRTPELAGIVDGTCSLGST